MKSMEIRSSEITTSGAGTLTGYVVRWDKLSELLWGEFYEKFQRGAFTEWLAAGNDVCNQVNHLIPTRLLVKGGEITCKMLK